MSTTQLFDKRSKFIHYPAETLVINNLEFDHADIFKDLDQIKWHFHQLIRSLPSQTKVRVPFGDENIKDLLSMEIGHPPNHSALTRKLTIQ